MYKPFEISDLYELARVGRPSEFVNKMDEQDASTSPRCESDLLADISNAILSENLGRLLRPVRRLLRRRRPEQSNRQTILRPLQQTLPEWMQSRDCKEMHASSLSCGPSPLRKSGRLQHSIKPTVQLHQNVSHLQTTLFVVLFCPFCIHDGCIKMVS